ncbi:RHS repeat-associated core domain-containing protein [Brevundimonas diminuta]|uniref:RHS repeat-associated core domain-containing protein n=1 Tax=Brevundimonas diminuta TaxID=293 RepID=UPI003207E024
MEAAGFATSGSTINTRFIRGPGVDEILASYTSAGSTPAQFWLSDERGSLVDTVNGSTGLSTAINTYDEYGNPGSGNVGRFQYTGQMWLPSFGAYHYKARAYHPGLGRFLQADLIGYAAGMNLYAYVGNDPINSIDPLGLFEDEPTDVDDVPAYGERCPWYAVCLFDRESIERFLADVADLGEIVVTASLGHTQRERRGILPSTEYFQCFAAGTGGDGTILGNFLAAAGLALAGSPIIDKPRAGFGGGGPSGIKTTMISESVRSLPGMSLRAPSALRGAAAAVSRPGTRPRNYGASLGRIGSRGAGYLSLGLTTEGVGRVVGIAQQCNQLVGR